MALRERAENLWLEQNTLTKENNEGLTNQAARDLLHELQVHQIELEMQNDELRLAQVELEASKSRFVDLYDFAPVGYCTVSATRLIFASQPDAGHTAE